jgi:hypothetical protein
MHRQTGPVPRQKMNKSKKPDAAHAKKIIQQLIPALRLSAFAVK